MDIRLAGIDEAGGTEKLDFSYVPDDVPQEVPANVVNLFGRR